ncbi:hypothetical protein [Faecalibacter bovis]|uniref:Uncharacterized protein n=1 Tax=Faecalibacter bovis TaxID=2898187 RepID=A0ABX7XEH9_9FLAO|nr:hypothetical protein [Faecalibacter bovis]QTV06357.1 hypothetical protein J9309_03230 [Faecalibacter bovis]
MKFINKLKYTILILFGFFQMVFASANDGGISSNSYHKIQSLFKTEFFDFTSIVNDIWNKNSLVDIIQANDNVINYSVKRSSLISDDSIDGNIGSIILSGVNKNARISTTGNWPLGYSIDTETGDLVIANAANRIAGPLQYTICNLLGVCSTANITIDNGTVSNAVSSIFTLESEVLESCFTGNANTKKVRYTLKNVSGREITIDEESATATFGGKKIKFNGDNINVNSLNVISGNMSFTGLIGYVKEKTFAKDEVVIFELNFSSLNFSDEITGGLELRYGNSTASGPMDNPDLTLRVSNTIYKTPSKPNVSNNGVILLTPGASYTVYQASGLTDAPSTLRFYDANNVEIPFDTPIDMTFTETLEYSVTKVSVAGCESQKTYLTFSKTTVELPNPGEVSLSSNSSGATISETTICQFVDEFNQDNEEIIQNSFTIYNKADGQGTYVTPNGARYALKYSWEVSYDDGLTWYTFEDSDGNAQGETSNGKKEITINNVKKDVWIRRKAQERPEGTRPNRFAFSNIIKIEVQKNEIILSGGNYHTRALTFLDAEDENGLLVLNEELNKFVFPEITTSVPSIIQIIGEDGTIYNPGDIFNFTAEGTYSFTIKAKSIAGEGVIGNCETFATLSLTVYDLNKCKIVTDKIIATQSGSWYTTLAGLVANSENAYDNDMSTHSTISIVLGALGLGTTWQNLMFDHVVEAGTPLKVKLGQEYSGVQVAGGITIVGLDENGNQIGAIKSVGEGALLDALTGDNVFEFSFVPTDGNGVAKPYKGVRVILGSVLALGNNAVLYGAYYEKERIIQDNEPTVQQPIYVKGAKLPVTNTQENQLRYIMPETPEDIVVLKPENSERGIKLNDYVSDVSWGNQDAGLGVATALSSVVYPYLAVDDDPLTYTIFNKTVGALNVQTLNINLRRTARPGDEIEVIMTNEGTNLLSLDLGADFTVQRYMDDVPVGAEIASNQFKVINLNLFLFKDPIPRFRVAGINQPFNRVEFRYFSGVQANLGNQMYLHDVSIVPQSVFDGNLNVTDNVELCAADFIKFKKPSACTEYQVSFVLGKEVQKDVLNPDGTTSTITSYDELEDLQLEDNFLKRVYENNTEAYYEIKRLYELAPDQILLLKVQTIQNGENFGGPQYIRVSLKNCLESIVNPVINLDTKELN